MVAFKEKRIIHLVIEGFPCIIIISSLTHQRIGHRKTTQTGIIQVTKRVRRNLRNKFLHHRRTRTTISQHNRRRTDLRHFRNTAVQVGYNTVGIGIGRGAVAVLCWRRESSSEGECSKEREESDEETEGSYSNGEEEGLGEVRENIHL